jgi:hypothetical protein
MPAKPGKTARTPASPSEDSEVELLSQAHVARSQYGDPTRLAGLIELARLELSKDGYELAPWSMPWSNPQIV